MSDEPTQGISFMQLTRLYSCACFMLLVFLATVQQSIGDEPAAKDAVSTDPGIESRLERMRRPWTEPVHRLTSREYEATLEYWAKEFASILSVETAGVTREGVRIKLLRITDANTPDTDKQVCLISALHGGPERSGTTTVMHAIEWLLSDDPEAVETRRRQVVLLLPIINPYAYFETDRFGNSSGIDPYTGGGPANWDLKTMTYKAVDKAPEVKAVLNIVDLYQPEVHIDVHGTGLQEYPDDKLGNRTRYQGQTMFEVTGSAYSNYALRPWDWRVTDAIIAAGVEAGYPSDRFEADAQRAYWGPSMQAVSHQMWRGRPNFYTAQYAYAKYHTMVAALEVGWEASGLARLKGMLRIGNRVWPTERQRGYPVDRVGSFIGHYVTSVGQTAAARRHSRVELWERQAGFTQAVLYPQTDGRDTYFVAMNTAGQALLDESPDVFVDHIRSRPEFDADTLSKFLAAGPEIKIAIDRASRPTKTADALEHGIGFRLRLPYRSPELLDVRVNGFLLGESETDGYTTWFGNGFTHVQINLSAEKARGRDLFAITCVYRPDVERKYGWKPPAAVLEKLKDSQ